MLTLRLFAFIAMVVGALRLAGIRLPDLFKAVVYRPKSIKEQIDEATNKKKKNLIRREIEEITDILKMTGREDKIPVVFIICGVFAIAGAVLAALFDNAYMIPSLAIGMMFIPVWYIKLTASHYKKDVSEELETALSIITTAYIRNEDIVTAVEENISYLNAPIKDVFTDFLVQLKLIDSDTDKAILSLKEKIDNDVFHEWCDTLLLCQQDRGLKTTIWNEPDLDNDDSGNKRTWGGTKAEFFDLYEITAKHLKSLFPNLKIGGPALAYNEEWGEDFLCEMQKRKVPIDFFSWHVYCTEPISIGEKSARIRALLDKYGYEKTESILNEWNYIRGWTDQYIYSINAIHSVKGAAFTMACITKAQHSDIDMLMYYDTRPSVFCGAFDFYTYEKLKGYYPLYWYGMMYDALGEVPSEGTGDNVYALCGKMADGKALAIITYYTDCATDEKKEILADFGHGGKFEIYLVDKTHSGELLEKTGEPKVTLSPCSFALIREV